MVFASVCSAWRVLLLFAILGHRMAELHGDRSARHAREAAFHDECFTQGLRAEASRFYRVSRRSEDDYRAAVLKDVAGLQVLEYGCGTGSSAFEIVSSGGHVLGIDISPVAIAKASEMAAARALDRSAQFRVMNAEKLELPDQSIDLVCGSGILHHLDLTKAFAEIGRVLKPGGRGVFLEPLGHNPVIYFYRMRTPHLRTPDEHPLLRDDLDLARRYFSRLDARHYHLCSLATVPLIDTPALTPALRVAEAVDGLLLASWSPLRYWAWQVLIQVTR